MKRHLLLFSVALFSAAAFPVQTTIAGISPAELYEKGMNALTGVGVSRNDLTAAEYIRRSADLGYAPAQVTLGYLYETGTILARQPQVAAQWYRRAAQQEDILGELLLGRGIFIGLTSMRDLNEADDWLLKAASHQDPFSEYLLGLIRLERGDYPQAAEWFRKAADQGLPQAQRKLGELLKNGKGLDVDKFQAYVWLLMSFDAGIDSVAPELQQLEAELGSNQVEQAKSKARELETTVARAVLAKGCTGWPGEFDPVPSAPPPALQRFCR